MTIERRTPFTVSLQSRRLPLGINGKDGITFQPSCASLPLKGRYPVSDNELRPFPACFERTKKQQDEIDDYELPPYRPLYPLREAATMSFAAILVLGLFVFGTWYAIGKDGAEKCYVDGKATTACE